MANHDDMSADLDRGSEEPDRGSVEPIGVPALPAVPSLPSLPRRAVRAAVGSSAAKPGPSTRPLRTRSSARPAASEVVPTIERTPAAADAPTADAPAADAPAAVIDDDRTRPVAAPLLDAAAMASGAPPADPAAPRASDDAGAADASGPVGGRGGVLRQGLPKSGAYRASAVTRSLRATPVAGTPIVESPAATAPRVATTADAPATIESAMRSLTDPPRRYVVTVRRPASDPAIGGAEDGRAASPEGREGHEGPEAHDGGAGATSGAIASTAPAAIEAPDPAVMGSTGADPSPPAAPLASIEVAPHIPVETLDAPPPELLKAMMMRVVALSPEVESLPPIHASIIDRVPRSRSLRIGLGVLGAAVVGAVILVVALRSSRSEPPTARPAAADLAHAVSSAPADTVDPPAAVPPPVMPPPPRAADVVEPEVAAPAAATPAPPAPAAVKPAPPAPVAAKPVAPSAPVHAASAPPARPSPPREPAHAAKPSPSRAAKPLTYDPDALFLPKP